MKGRGEKSTIARHGLIAVCLGNVDVPESVVESDWSNTRLRNGQVLEGGGLEEIY